MNVLLIQPEPNTRPIGFDRSIVPEPLGLETIAASIPEHKIEILDLRLDSDLNSVLERFSPQVVGVTALTTDIYTALAVLKQVKDFSADIFTIAGGLHATLVPKDFTQSYVDAICLGDGETVLPAVIKGLNSSLRDIPNLIWRDGNEFVDNGRIFGRSRLDIDDTPIPRRDLTASYRSKYHFYSTPIVAMSTGRGCPCRCNFCSVWKFYGGSTLQLSARRVVEELRQIDHRLVGFTDDNFLTNHKRDNEIADRIKAEGIKHNFMMQCRTDYIVRHRDLIEKWANIGLGGVLLGLESASDDFLRVLNKRNSTGINDHAIRILQDLDIIVWGAFIVDPQWTIDDFDKLERYIISHQLTPVQYTILTPLPGTDLYVDKYDELLTHDYRCYDTMHSVLPTKLPREEFYRQFARLQGLRQTGKWYEWISSGKADMKTLKWGAKVAKQLSNWESYIEFDPVLGNK